jgi:quercetin dioxygenase-like cupin family protein
MASAVWEGNGMTITSAADEGPVDVLGTTHTIKIRHAGYTVIESTGGPDTGLPPHALEGQDQSIYVLAGQYQLVTGDQRRLLTTGASAFVARDTVHCLTAVGTVGTVGTEPARCLMIVSPPGPWEAFLDELRDRDATTAQDEIYAVGRRAGIVLLTSPV